MKVLLILPMARNLFMDVPEGHSSVRVPVFSADSPLLRHKSGWARRAVSYEFRPCGSLTPNGVPIWTVNGEPLP